MANIRKYTTMISSVAIASRQLHTAIRSHVSTVVLPKYTHHSVTPLVLLFSQHGGRVPKASLSTSTLSMV